MESIRGFFGGLRLPQVMVVKSVGSHGFLEKRRSSRKHDLSANFSGLLKGKELIWAIYNDLSRGHPK